jgi:hypothetical protein
MAVDTSIASIAGQRREITAPVASSTRTAWPEIARRDVDIAVHPDVGRRTAAGITRRPPGFDLQHPTAGADRAASACHTALTRDDSAGHRCTGRERRPRVAIAAVGRASRQRRTRPASNDAA